MAAKKVNIHITLDSAGVPVVNLWDMTTQPATPIWFDEIPSIAEECDCCCDEAETNDALTPTSRVIQVTQFKNGVPFTRYWEVSNKPPVEIFADELPRIAKPCFCCNCADGSGGGGGVEIGALPVYDSVDDAINDNGLQSGDLYRLSSANINGQPVGDVYQKP